MPESWTRLIESMHWFAPFVLHTQQGEKVNWERVFEAVLIAVLAGGAAALGGSYVAGLVMEVKLETLRDNVQDVEDELRELRRDLYMPRRFDPTAWSPDAHRV